MEAYSYKLDVFEGPLDLLLHLIEKHKIDIYDIPVVEITSQYLGYLENWKQFDIAYSSEFVVMAATLLQIKSRMMLPRESAKVNEGEDPRDELVARLLEFKEIKAFTEILQQKLDEAGKAFNRPEALSLWGTESVFSFDISKLYELFKTSYERKEETIEEIPLVKVEKEVYSLADKLKELKSLIRKRTQLNFEELIDSCRDKEEKVVTFLAVLELLKFQFFKIVETGKVQDEIVLIYSNGKGAQAE